MRYPAKRHEGCSFADGVMRFGVCRRPASSWRQRPRHCPGGGPSARNRRLRPRCGPASATVAAPKGDQYYVEFRSRYAQSYGHAFVVFGRGSGPGKERSIRIRSRACIRRPTARSRSGSGTSSRSNPKTGRAEGDTDEIYVSARYRVMLNKADYDRNVRLHPESPEEFAHVAGD